MSTEVTPVQPQNKPALAVGGRISPIVPQDLDQAWRLAKAIAAAGFAPKSYMVDVKNPTAGFDVNKIALGIMHGLEVGLTPMAALQSIAVVNGMPSIWGDGALGLVRASGLLEDFSETLEGEGDLLRAVVILKRQGQSTPIVGTFSVAEAKKAGLWTKSGPWTAYPQRMLKMRARSWALRDGFADVLRGLRVVEEAQDFQGMGAPSSAPIDITPPRPALAALAHDAEPDAAAAAAIASINAAQDFDDLTARWSQIDEETAESPDVWAAYDARRAELTQAAGQSEVSNG